MNAAVGHFRGFPPDGIPFFFELQEQQSRTWFAANKQRFERLWAEPLRALVADLTLALGDTYPGLAEVRPHFFRIQRDVRFSADKSPYKTNVSAMLPVRATLGEDETVPGIYLSFGLDGGFVGVGCWQLDREKLDAYRRAVAEDQTGAALGDLVDRLRKTGFELSSHGELKRPPAPYPRDHPRAELLRRKGLAIANHNVPDDLLDQPQLVDWMADSLRRAAPLTRWLDRTLG
jgi:uncharacterized protein (TIGR02453 family)